MTPQTLLFRQAHPNLVPNGVLTSAVFTPNENDNGLLSVYDGDLISAPDSHTHYTTCVKKESCGVWAVTCDEVQRETVPAASSPVEETAEQPANPAHAHLDFTAHEKKKHRAIAKNLKKLAIARGCLYPPV